MLLLRRWWVESYWRTIHILTGFSAIGATSQVDGQSRCTERIGQAFSAEAVVNLNAWLRSAAEALTMLRTAFYLYEYSPPTDMFRYPSQFNTLTGSSFAIKRVKTTNHCGDFGCSNIFSECLPRPFLLSMVGRVLHLKYVPTAKYL